MDGTSTVPHCAGRLSLLRFALLWVLPGVFTLSASAQPAMTVEQYRDSVVAYSFRLKISEQTTEAAYQTAQKLKKGFLPYLSASGDFSVNFRDRWASGADGLQWLHPYSFTVQPSVVQTIYGGGGVKNSYRQAQIGVQMSALDQQFTLLDVLYAADYAYWNLAAGAELYKASRQYVEIIRSLQEVVTIRFQDGYIAKTDLLMIEARLSEAEYGQVNALKNYQVALHNFNVLMGTPLGGEVKLMNDILAGILLPQKIGIDQVLTQRPDYQAALRNIDYQAYGVKLAASSYNPQLSLGVSGVWRNTTPNYQGKTELDGLAFLKLSIPIFAWGERRRAVAAQKAHLQSSKYTAAQSGDQVAQEVNDAWTGIEQSAQQVAASLKSLQIARENLDLSTYSYNEGQLTILDVLSAQLSWIQLYTNAITANFNQKVSISQYRRAVGQITP